jgi:hypothetical protein
MSGQLTLAGSELVATPQCAAGSVPSGITNIPLALNPCNKPFNVSTGDQQYTANSPSSYVTLSGIGVGGVTAASFFWMNCPTGIQVKLTLADASTLVVFVSGNFMLEATAGKEVTLAQVQGSATIEYFASGMS